jgi:hypothetical protein
MFYKRIDASCTLIQGMADRLGTDVPGAIGLNPELEAPAYRSAVLRCAACGEHEACKKLQAENPRLDRAPAYCRNW